MRNSSVALYARRVLESTLLVEPVSVDAWMLMDRHTPNFRGFPECGFTSRQHAAYWLITAILRRLEAYEGAEVSELALEMAKESLKIMSGSYPI